MKAQKHTFMGPFGLEWHDGGTQRLNMELDLPIWAACAQLYSLAETPQPPNPLRIWTHIRGRYWSAKIDDISM
jgi:hypothetical protein